MIKAAIFDLDGTVLDSMGAWTELDINFLKAHGKTARSDVHDAVKALTLRQSAQYFQREYGVELTEDKIIDEIKLMIRTAYEKEIGLISGVYEVLNFLHSTGMPMVIATATDCDMAVAALKRLNVLDFFGKVFTCDMVGKSKTEPDVFLAAAEYLGVSPEDTLVFEDSSFAAHTAYKAGFKIAFIAGEESAPDFADIELHGYAELENYIKQQKTALI